MDAIDAYIPEPTREVDKPFLMAIEDVFSIEGRGTVATGRIERGMVKVGEEVEIVGFGARNPQDDLHRRRNVQQDAGLRDRPATTSAACSAASKREDIERGQVLAKPGSITPHTKFEAEVYVLSKEEGGRHTPFFSGYRPQFYFRTTDVTGTAELAGRRRDVHAGRQRQAPGGVDLARSPWTRTCVLPSARAAGRSAPAW